MRIAVVLLLLLLAGAAAWWSFGGPAAPPPIPDDGAGVHVADDVDSQTGETVAPDAPTVAEASIDRSHAAAGENEHGLPQAPDDATWVEITVIDRDSQEPVPFAKVLFSNKHQQDLIAEMPYVPRQRYEREYWRGAEEYGYRAIADAEGKARVWFDDPRLVVIAHLDERFGYRNFNVNEHTHAETVEIAPEVKVRAHVHTANGEHAAGVTVGLRQVGEKRKARRGSFSNYNRRTGPDGIVTFDHVQMLQRWQWGDSKGQTVPHLALTLHQPELEFEPVKIDAQQPPSAPVELQVPASGHLRFRPLIAGKPAPIRWGVRIAEADDERYYYRSWQSIYDADDDGWVEFRHVALGKTYQITSGAWTARVAGPTRPDETVSREAELSDTHCVMVAQLLAADGEPIREEMVTAKYGEQPNRGTMWATTDSEGRCTWLQRQPKDGSPLVLAGLSVNWQPKESGQTQLHTIGSVSLPVGVTDLGDVQLAVTKPIVAGRIEPDCDQYGKLGCSIQRLVTYGGKQAKSRWRSLHQVTVKVEDDLTFAAYGELPPGPYRIRVWGASFVPFEPVEFAPGATDLVLRPRCGHTMQCHTLLPEGLKGSTLQMVLKSQGAEDRSFWGTHRQEVEGHADHDWKGLPPGTYSFTISQEGQYDTKLYVQDNVQIPAASDTPLQVDLRDKLKPITLVIDVAADIAPGQFYVFPTPSDPQHWRGDSAPLGRSVTTVPPNAHEITVTANGFQPQTVPLQGGEVAVTLQPWPTASVAVSGLEGLPEHTSIRVYAYPVQEGAKDKRRYSVSWNSGDLIDLLQGGPTSKTIEQGRVELPVGTRRMKLTVTAVGRKPYRSVKLKDYSPRELASGGSHLITVPPAEAARVVAELARLKEEKANKKR